VIRSKVKPTDCDIVVIILWSRLGSPIAQPNYAKSGGGYLTGTEWEYYNAVEAFEASGQQRPAVLVYHRVDEPVCKVSPKDKQAYLDRVTNMEQVEDFLKACHTRDGSIPNAYQIPSDFADALEQHLKAIVRQRLESLGPQVPPDAKEDVYVPPFAKGGLGGISSNPQQVPSSAKGGLGGISSNPRQVPPFAKGGLGGIFSNPRQVPSSAKGGLGGISSNPQQVPPSAKGGLGGISSHDRSVE